MNTQKWSLRMLGVARLVSSWSKDPERKVGVVVADNRFRIVSTGFNGYPSGIDDTNKEDKNSLTVHAEVNAIINDTSKMGRRMFIWGGHPCSNCALAIIQAGITSLVCPSPELGSKWTKEMDIAQRVLGTSEMFVNYYTLPRKNNEN